MTDAEIVAMLRRYKDGRLSEREAVAYLEKSSVEELGFAEVDHARERRQGFPEAVEMVQDGLLAVNVQGRPFLVRQFLEVDVFTVERAVFVSE